MKLLTKKQGNQIFSDLLRAPLKEMGFTFQRGSIKRVKKYGFDKIGYDEIEYWGSQFKLAYSASKRIDPIEEIWGDYLSELHRVGESFVSLTLAFDVNRIKDYEYDPGNLKKRMLQSDKYEMDATEEGVSEMANQFLNNIKLYIVPTFDKFNNIQVLDAFANEKPEYYLEVTHLFSRDLYYKKMIIAKLAGNKDFELVSEAMRERILKVDAEQGPLMQAKYLSVHEKLYNRLKSVEPLANPVLD